MCYRNLNHKQWQYIAWVKWHFVRFGCWAVADRLELRVVISHVGDLLQNRRLLLHGSFRDFGIFDADIQKLVYICERNRSTIIIEKCFVKLHHRSFEKKNMMPHSSPWLQGCYSCSWYGFLVAFSKRSIWPVGYCIILYIMFFETTRLRHWRCYWNIVPV